MMPGARVALASPYAVGGLLLVHPGVAVEGRFSSRPAFWPKQERLRRRSVPYGRRKEVLDAGPRRLPCELLELFEGPVLYFGPPRPEGRP